MVIPLRLYGYILLAAMLAAGVFAIYQAGKDADARKEIEDAINTHERVNDADTGNGDADADRDWLRARGGR